MPNSEIRRQGDAVEFLTGRYTELTDGEKQIVDYLINNLESALAMSVHTLAKESGVSVATIVPTRSTWASTVTNPSVFTLQNALPGAKISCSIFLIPTAA